MNVSRADFISCYNAIRLASFKGDRYDKYVAPELQDSDAYNAAKVAFHNAHDNRQRGLRTAWWLLTQGKNRNIARNRDSYRYTYDTIRADLAANPM